MIDAPAAGDGAAAEEPGVGGGPVDVVDELLYQGSGVMGEGLAVLDGEPAAAAGVQLGLGDGGVRSEAAGIAAQPLPREAWWSAVIAAPVACR